MSTPKLADTTFETVFTYGSPSLKFGPGSSGEIGYDLAQLGASRALVVTDAGLAATGLPQRVADQLGEFDVAAEIFDGVHVEPTDASIAAALAWAREREPFDAFVAVGGGSCIDTAKALNLLLTNPGELTDYLNRPFGEARAPSRPLHPLVAVPTTTGTGAESTTVCILDLLDRHVKTGISHPRLRPMLAVVDPDLTVTQPAGVTASAGLDVLCHALESYTAKPYTAFARKSAQQRVPYCGSNPISDLWAQQALRLMSTAFVRAVHDGDDREARTAMAMASTFAGLGFGNAGVHIPHANAYPIAGRVRDFRPDGYPGDEAMVPHGMSVALTAPAAFRFTYDTAPERHHHAAELLAPDLGRPSDPREHLPLALTTVMQAVGLPNGLAAIGYVEADVEALVDGALQQQRLLAIAPREVTADDLASIVRSSFELW